MKRNLMLYKLFDRLILHAVGLVRSLDADKSPLEAMRWGLCHEYKGDWQYIRRFESYMPHVW